MGLRCDAAGNLPAFHTATPPGSEDVAAPLSYSMQDPTCCRGIFDRLKPHKGLLEETK